MEHRQRPEIDRVTPDVGGDDIADREQIGAAMVVDDALGIASRARGVVERDRVPFVAWRRALVSLVALGDQRLVVEPANPLARAVILRVVVVDEERAGAGVLQRRGDDRRKFAIDNDCLGLAVIEHEGDRGRVEAGVERVEHGAAHRNAIVTLEHRRRVGEHDRDCVAAAEAAPGERGGELLRSRVERAVAAAKGAMGDRRPIRKHRRRPLEQGERRQRLKIGRVAVEIAVVGRNGHRAELRGALGATIARPRADWAGENDVSSRTKGEEPKADEGDSHRNPAAGGDEQRQNGRRDGDPGDRRESDAG